MTPKSNDITQLIGRFRIATRELYNSHLQKYDYRWNWELSDGFKEIQRRLFTLMVSDQVDAVLQEYGTPQSNLCVVLREEISSAPIQINREVNSGYWDYPLDSIDKDVTLQFVSFFDWEDLTQIDHRYINAVIEGWPRFPETKGKHVLIDWMYADFILR